MQREDEPEVRTKTEKESGDRGRTISLLISAAAAAICDVPEEKKKLKEYSNAK